MGPILRETSSPSGEYKLQVHESQLTFKIFRNGKEVSSGKVAPQRGCAHKELFIPDSGSYFAVWQTPLNSKPEENEPLAIFAPNGSLLQKLALFDLFTRDELKDDLEKSKRFA